MFDPDFVVTLVHVIALMALIAVAFGIVQRTALAPALKNLAVGLIFGLGAIVSMKAPVHLMPGVIVDGRSIFIGLGAAFTGPLGALGALALGAGYRLQLGGAGMASGVSGMCIAAAMGLVWRRYGAALGHNGVHRHLLAGAMISMQFVAIFLLPLELAKQLWLTVFPPLFLASLASAVLLGFLIERERKMINRENRLRSDAEVDFLTGLTNRRRFERDLGGLRAGPSARGVAHTLVLFDIDHFKAVNDSWGHEAGDRVLVAFGRLLRDSCRPNDIVARIGGEEFALLLRDMPEERAGMVVERILEATRLLQVAVPGGGVRVTASSGYAEFSGEAATAGAVMEAADRALYAAKRAGRDQARRVDVAAAA